MIETKNRRFLFILVALQVLICVFALLLLFFRDENISVYSQEVMTQGTMTLMEDRMRERVETIILSIDQERSRALSEVRELGAVATHFISHVDDGKLYEHLQEWTTQIFTTQYGQALQLLLCDEQAETFILFSSDGERKLSPSDADALPRGAAYYDMVSSGRVTLYVFALQDDIDTIVKDYAHDLVHAVRYGEDGYVWINEIVNYEGGNEYAIRVAHPNLSDAEGEYLSTDTTDAAGGFPYLAELEGIRENGEVFHTYAFKNLNDDEIAEKASYARRYEPFDWIIATGEPLDAVLVYADTMAEHTHSMFNSSLKHMILIFLLVFALDILVIIISNRQYRRNVDAYVKVETELDALTGASSRKIGETALSKAFQADPNHQNSPLLMMLDIDDFKQVNDTYGHAVGDIVLRRIAQEIMRTIRKTDCLFRWGGEEFVMLCRDLDPADYRHMGEKVLKSVSALSFDMDDHAFSVTISIGASCFQKEDTDHLDALKRADAALYHCKKTGKNKYTHADEL